MFPYLDLTGFSARTAMPAADVALVEGVEPGWIEGQLEILQSHVNARLRKRYGTNGKNGRAGIPFGLYPAQPTAVGTNPPDVTLQGTPAVGSTRLLLAIVLAGALGTATFQWSADRGQSWTIGTILAATGTSPPVVEVSGTSELEAPADLQVEITTAGVLSAARFQWSANAGQTWIIGAAMASAGTTPPPVTLSGVSSLAVPDDLVVEITAAGPLGTAVYQWSQDGGATWVTGLQTSAQPTLLGLTGLSVSFGAGTYATNNVYTGQGMQTAAIVPLAGTDLVLAFNAGTYSADNVYAGAGIPTASLVPLLGTGVQAAFPEATYADDNVYSAATPVPEQILSWMAAIVTPHVMRKRGVNPQDSQMAELITLASKADEELKETANSETGLLDLPGNDSTDSAVTTGEPLGASDTSPYAWQDRQAREGRRQDYEEAGYGPGSGIWGR